MQSGVSIAGCNPRSQLTSRGSLLVNPWRWSGKAASRLKKEEAGGDASGSKGVEDTSISVSVETEYSTDGGGLPNAAPC